MMIDSLPRREREVFEALCRCGEATAEQVRGELIDPPSYSAVRAMLGRLEEKGFVTHCAGDRAFVYRTLLQPNQVRESVLKTMVRNFFGGSATGAATALLGLSGGLSEEEADALDRAIQEARNRR